jgi:predicted transcriptional regulator
LYVEDEDLDRAGVFIKCLRVPFDRRFVGVMTHLLMSRCNISAQNRVLVASLLEWEAREFICNVDKYLYTIMRNIKILTFSITSQHEIVELYAQDNLIAQLVISMLNEENFAKWGNKLTKV